MSYAQRLAAFLTSRPASLTRLVAHGATMEARLTEYNTCHNKSDGRFCSTPDAVAAGKKTPSGKAFRQWFGKSKVVDGAGNPLVVYHGTMSDFDEFDPSKGNIESYFGAGLYFSDELTDVGANYAGKGPDMATKLSQKAEEIADRVLGDDDEFVNEVNAYAAERGLPEVDRDSDDTGRLYDHPAVKAYAEREMGIQHGGATVPVYLRIENPVIVGEPYKDDHVETFFDYQSNYDPDNEDDDTEPSGKLVDFLSTLRSVAAEYEEGSVDEIIGELMEEALDYEGLSASRLIDRIKSNEAFSYYTDYDHPTGNTPMVSAEILRKTFEAMGFDGIIDHKAGQRFRNMEGTSSDTTHYIAFRPEQVKSAISNRGTFNPKSGKITEADPVEAALQRALQEMNPCHDPETGQFCSTRGWHLTDNPNFTPDPSFKPQLNSFGGDIVGDDRPAGIFVTDDPEFWMQAHGYERPYVAEVEGTVTNPPGTIMYRGREKFMQGPARTVRVLTIDEYAREKFGEPGWVEEHFDTASLFSPRKKMPEGYRGRSVSQMSKAEIREWERRFKQWRRRSR